MNIRAKVVVLLFAFGTALVGAALFLVNVRLMAHFTAAAKEDTALARAAFDDSLRASAEGYRVQAQIIANETLAKEALVKASPELLFTYADSAQDRTSAKYLVVVGSRGQVLADARARFRAGDTLPLGGAPAPYVGFASLGGELVAIAIVPIRLDDRVLGYLVLADPVTIGRLEATRSAAGSDVTLTTVDGTKLVSTLGASAASEAASQGRCAAGGIAPHEVVLDGTSRMLVSTVITGPDRSAIGCAVVTKSLEAQIGQIRDVQRWLVFVGLALTAAAVSLASLVALRILRPVREVTEAARRIAAGDISQKPLEVSGEDEVSELARSFNEMLGALRTLAELADGIATGDLTVRAEGGGQVGEAFNRMIEAQRHIVKQMRDASVQLAGAAAQIYAASQEQEGATAHQNAGVEEVSRTTQSLLESAAHIADSARGVLGSAERAKETTDQVAARLTELGAHTGRIAELLDIIREIAERSDLLALNASIESSRAGEAGRTFALVAAEMRRLAERVTGAVEDVRAMVTDIRASSRATVLATDETKKLSDGTTEAARQITRVTQQQRTATEQVLQSMRHIGAVLAESASATQQTRASAGVLKAEADRLQSLVGRFVTEARTESNGRAPS